MNDIERLIGAAGLGDIERVKSYLKKGIDVNCEEHTGLTPLHVAAATEGDHVEVCKYLIKKGANLEAKNKDGWTPLQFAAAAGNRLVAELLLQSGAYPNGPDFMSYPSVIAAASGHTELAEMLTKIEIETTRQEVKAKRKAKEEGLNPKKSAGHQKSWWKFW